MTTTINSNGSKWAGQAPDSIEKLLDVLAFDVLDRRFENEDGGDVFISKRCEVTEIVHFRGNFFRLSHVFGIDTDEPDVIDSLTAAIRANQQRADYLEQASPHAAAKEREHAERCAAYDERQEEKRDRLADRADRMRQTATAEFRKADLREEASGIPFGQPILAGHHSEGRHRRTIERAHNAMRRGIEADKKAGALEARANTTPHAISSDDPGAMDKLWAKVAKLKERQDYMRRINSAHRAWMKSPHSVKTVALLDALEPAAVVRLKNYAPAYSWEPHPYAPFELSNNNANIRRIEQRISEIEQAADTEPVEDIEGDGWTLREDVDENRVMFEFDGKPPAETRQVLKGHGFKWSPSRVAWVRMLNNAGRFAAQRVTAALNA